MSCGLHQWALSLRVIECQFGTRTKNGSPRYEQVDMIGVLRRIILSFSHVCRYFALLENVSNLLSGDMAPLRNYMFKACRSQVSMCFGRAKVLPRRSSTRGILMLPGLRPLGRCAAPMCGPLLCAVYNKQTNSYSCFVPRCGGSGFS